MKSIEPFRGLFYNQQKIPALKDVIAPPYDVIDVFLQKELFARSPYNFTRLDLPQEEGLARYKKVKELYADWLSAGVLIQDVHPAFYLYYHHYNLQDGSQKIRKGLFVAKRLDDSSHVKPHEKTLSAPKEDRLNMTVATEAQLSPVFALYDDPEKQIQKIYERLSQTTPFMDFVSEEGERHQLWKIKDFSLIEKIQETLSDKNLFIADGHHRFETANQYQQRVLSDHPDLPRDAAARFVLMFISNTYDDGLQVLPIHRCVHSLPNFNFNEFLEKLSCDFEVLPLGEFDQDEAFAKLSEASKVSLHSFVLVDADRKAVLISITHEKWLAHGAAQQSSSHLNELDVTVLHQLIFENHLHLSKDDQARQTNLRYIKPETQLMQEIQKKDCQFIVLMNATKMTDVQNVALAGEILPQKSTYFFPKVASGLLVHDLRNGVKDGV